MFESRGGVSGRGADPEGAPVLGRLLTAARAENCAAGERLAAIGELDALRVRQSPYDEQRAIDSTAAISTELCAVLHTSEGLACSYLRYARAMRDRLPAVGALLVAGQISYWMFRDVVFRTDLIEDAEIMARVDKALAARLARWGPLGKRRLAGYVDKLVARLDVDAVRQRRERRAERTVSIEGAGDGLCDVYARLKSIDAHALDAKVDALAASVCEHDPRSHANRRADALGALAFGAQVLACGCGRPDCPAASTPAPAPVLIHVVAEQASLEGTGSAPAAVIGEDLLIPPELLAELAEQARWVPLVHPGDSPAEAGYTPSAALADFVRCRDLTCRFPGCHEPATHCDIDHTVAFADGGPTHASKHICC